MFDRIRNWFEVRGSMRDARRRRAQQSILNTVIVVDKLKHIEEMLLVGRVEYATATLDDVLARFPEEAIELPATITVLLKLKRLDDAETLTARGVQRNPDSREFARLHCHIADHRGDKVERVRRWQAFRRRYPAYAPSFQFEARALLAAGDDAAAEAVLAEGVRIVPDDVHLAVEYAQRADHRRDWPEAVRRWTVVRDRFGSPTGAFMTAAALIHQGLDDQGDAALRAARLRFPNESRVIEDQAALAERRGDLDAALAHWAELRRSFAHLPRGYTEAARLLRARDDEPAADAMVAEGAARAPDHRAPPAARREMQLVAQP